MAGFHYQDREAQMSYPKDIQPIAELAIENQDILIETYQANPDVFISPSRIPLIVEVFRVLHEHHAELEGPMLELLAGCSYQIFTQGFHGMRDAAEPVFLSASVRAMAN